MKHLKEMKQNYFVHAGQALFYSVFLLALSITALVHALFPMLFVSTTSSGVSKIESMIWEKQHKEDEKPGLTI